MTRIHVTLLAAMLLASVPALAQSGGAKVRVDNHSLSPLIAGGVAIAAQGSGIVDRASFLIVRANHTAVEPRKLPTSAREVCNVALDARAGGSGMPSVTVENKDEKVVCVATDKRIQITGR